MMSAIYRFPPNLRAAEADLDTQAAYTADKAYELRTAACIGEGSISVIEKAWDSIQAAEGVLRKYSDELVEHVYGAVEGKCRMRGDYEESGGKPGGDAS